MYVHTLKQLALAIEVSKELKRRKVAPYAEFLTDSDQRLSHP
ncbi:6182_t:CDS:2 [Funneliformis mosseae]|uniref:6182_t:CDS:1 n=1 Tax=Funneliformis mosseae TaxID=27381 RepID=A0A9N8V4P6_FUNMO|nr:6182_t:CDS:2 [Funneliformis mosseae]